jgi:hypothetical protein
MRRGSPVIRTPKTVTAVSWVFFPVNKPSFSGSLALSLSLSPLLGEPFHPSRLFLQSHILLLLVHYFYENIFSKEQAGAMMDTEKLAVGVVKRQSGNNHAVITPNLLSLNLRDEPTTC